MDKKINKCGCGGMAEFERADYWLWISCNHCGNRTDRYSINSNSEQLSMIVEEWNKAHPEPLEISNAMQAVKLLQEGEKICSNKFTKKTNIDYLVLDNGFLHAVKGGQCINESYCLYFYDLQDNNWQLYESPKYKGLTTEEALKDFALNGRNKHIVITLNDCNEYCIVGIDECHLILRNSKGEEEVRPRGHFKNCTWKFYYE